TTVMPPVPYVPFPDLDGTQLNGLTLSTATLDPNPYPGTPYAVGSGAALGSGSYSRIIWLPPTLTATGGDSYRVDIRIRSVGTDGNKEVPASVTVDAVVSMEITLTNPYQSGAFLGAGVSGKLFDGGNIRVAGSIHLLGNDNPPPTQVKFNNGSSQVNNYIGIDDPTNGLGTLFSKLPPLATVDFNGETVSTLESVLRLRAGKVLLGSKGSIGEPDVSGNGDKETLDAIYSDGTITPATGDIYADVTDVYDMGEVTFPGLADPYTDPHTGMSYPSYADWLDAHSYQPLAGGDLIIEAGTASFSFTDAAGKGSIVWDANTDVLTVNGIVKVDGQVKLGKKGPPGGDLLAAVKYQGTGVLYATDKIEIHKDLYPAGLYLQDGPDPDSAVDGNLGLVTATEILVESGSPDPNVRVLAALYAENRIKIKEPSNIAGAAATNFLDLNSAGLVRIWQVPRLASLYPSGMPADASTLAISGSITNWHQSR
ncbi:MAG: hypothetical protein ACE5HV_12660, partial [Acidobacteriota bacterium]